MHNSQAAFWKLFILRHINVEELANLSPGAHSFPVVEEYLDKVLPELTLLGRGALIDRRLQIEVVLSDCPEDKTPVWAFFPINRRRRIAKEVSLEPCTRVLLVFYFFAVVTRPETYILDKLRHQLGHVLLYLQRPRAKNDCSAADAEWKKWIK